jgi:hypothetical protein
MSTQNWRREHTLLTILISVFVVGYAWWPFLLRRDDPSTSIYTWLIMAILLIAFMLVIGWGITGRLLGILINEHYKMSLSQFQLVLWTILILSAWIAAVTWNVAIGDPTPLGISIPAQVWALLGISVASLVGAPVILSAKTKRTPATEEQKASLRRIAPQEKPNVANTAYMSNLAQPGADVQGAATNVGIRFKGLVVSRTDPSNAKFSDLFSGDEVGNAGLVDVGKVQMFFFTLIIALAYASSIGEIMVTATSAGINMFPELDASMVTLMGISHVGYLGYKAAPHTKTDETGQTDDTQG